jgi:cytochrome P450
MGELKTLTMCIKEALRLHTTVPFIQRHTTKDCFIDGFFIPKGTIVSISLYSILHHPDVWEKPMVMSPVNIVHAIRFSIIAGVHARAV